MGLASAHFITSGKILRDSDVFSKFENGTDNSLWDTHDLSSNRESVSIPYTEILAPPDMFICTKLCNDL